MNIEYSFLFYGDNLLIFIILNLKYFVKHE